MKKYLAILLCLFLCSCVVKYNRNNSVASFPIIDEKKSITIILQNHSNYELEKAKENYLQHFKNSNLFSEVSLDNQNNADYTLFISGKEGGSGMSTHCILTSIISGFTLTIFPGICNAENAREIDLKLQNNHTQKVQNNYHIDGFWMSMGILVIFAMPFTDNVYSEEDKYYDNVVLRTYYMMEVLE